MVSFFKSMMIKRTPEKIIRSVSGINKKRCVTSRPQQCLSGHRYPLDKNLREDPKEDQASDQHGPGDPLEEINVL